MPQELAAVIIPVYKETPTNEELVSLTQCFKILHGHPIIFIAPASLDTHFYQALTAKNSFLVERFEDFHFNNITAYNRLMLRTHFYKRFKLYDYILLYQLDAYVFKDELIYWCRAGYDYIGAPWFVNWDKAQQNAEFSGVGNGGFSLRNVKSFLRGLSSFHYLMSPALVLTTMRKEGLTFPSVKRAIGDLTIRNNTYSRFNNYMDNEDIFWGLFVPQKFPAFRVAPVEIASRFAMEVNARTLFEKNSRTLPFGCHAWVKYDIDFWRQFIPYPVK
jgi:hypothetical protein